MKVFQVDDYHFVRNVQAMLDLRDEGYGGRGIRSTPEYLDQDFGTWMATRKVHDHSTVGMTTPDGETVPIDVAIAPLIQSLWDQVVRTYFCCQGGTPTPTGPREANIVFHFSGLDAVAHVLDAAGVRNVHIAPEPADHPESRTAYFDPIE